MEFYWFKFLNRVNSALRLLTRGRIQLFNKYQTEEQDRLLYRDFHKELKLATKKLLDNGLLTAEQKRKWDKLPVRSLGVGERFSLISIAKLLD